MMRLAVTGLFQARWTDAIHDEWMRNVAADRPDISFERLARCRKLMDEHAPDSLVAGYESIIPTLDMPNPDDRHVLAAAIHGGAGTIVTFNLRDFPASILERHSVEAVHPDDFIVRLWEESPAAVLDVAHRHRAALKKPPISAENYIAMLKRSRLQGTAACLRPYAAEI